ncbi:MAG: hypothetical protein QOG31_69 [Thermoplasmata archaeon]|jgi:hypothetical protein|nr:hypothetical protein [Thermoplasmata archaeon]
MTPLLAASWSFQLGWEVANPIAYLNLGGFVLALLLLRHLGPRRGEGPLVDGAWAASVVFAAGTGLHLLGDLTNFPEEWDHLLIHAVTLLALLVLFLTARRED